MTSFIGLPTRQAQCLHAIVRYIDETGQSPTLEDISWLMGQAVGQPFTKQQIHTLVNELKEKGRITSDPKKHRSITVVEKKDASFSKKAH